MQWNCKMSFFVMAVLISICGMTNANGQTPTIDFVVDLDGVLIFDRISNNAPENKIIIVSGHRYRLAEWSGEFLQFLSEIPGARVTFYSSGPKGSNVEVLKHIVLPNGKTAYEIALDGIDLPRIFERDFWIHNSRKKNLSSLPFFRRSESSGID